MGRREISEVGGRRTVGPRAASRPKSNPDQGPGVFDAWGLTTSVCGAFQLNPSVPWLEEMETNGTSVRHGSADGNWPCL
jgi:hypothetical protein